MIEQSEVDALAARILHDAEAAGLRRVAILPRLPRHLRSVARLDLQVLDSISRLGDGHVGRAGCDAFGAWFELRERPRGPLPPESAFRATLAPYERLGVVEAGELLLEPAVARRMVDDVEKFGVVVLGLDCWHYVDREKGWIMEEAGAGLDLSELVDSPDAVARSAEEARAFIAAKLPAETEFVSLVLDVPHDWRDASLRG